MATTNFIITKGNISKQMNSSLKTLIDCESNKAVCISYDIECKFIAIENCPDALHTLLWNHFSDNRPDKDLPVNIDALGGNGICMGLPIQIDEVLRVVSEWVNE